MQMCNSVIATTEFVRGLCDPALFFVLFEADATQNGRDSETRPSRGRGQSGTAGGDLGVAVAVLGSKEHNSTVAPPEAEANDSGDAEAADCKEEPVLTHLADC